MSEIDLAKVKALELAQASGGPPEQVVARAHVYHGFLRGTSASPAGAAIKPSNDKAATGATADKAATKGAGDADKASAEKAAAAKAAAEKKAAADKAAASKADKAPADKAPAGKAQAGKGAPSAQSVPADTKAPGGKNSYADVVALLHKVQNSAAGRPECFKILLEDGGAAKSVRDLKPAYYDAVCEACKNVISDEGEPAGGEAAADEDALGDLDSIAGGPERDEMGLS